jgi:hypothetical protein
MASPIQLIKLSAEIKLRRGGFNGLFFKSGLPKFKCMNDSDYILREAMQRQFRKIQSQKAKIDQSIK